MIYPARKKKILEIIDGYESLSVMDIAQKLNMSPATIRRDLIILADEGLIIRTHGGAMKLEEKQPISFSGKQNDHHIYKRAIGKRASMFVNNGDTIFMDCGSTVFEMCRHLKQLLQLRVITNSLPVVEALSSFENTMITLIGGELDKERRAIHGDTAVRNINNYRADKAFIGIDALSVIGLSSHSEKEASITNAFLQNAKEIYLLCDSSKIGKDSYVKIGNLSMINYLITDKALDSEFVIAAFNNGVKIITAINQL